MAKFTFQIEIEAPVCTNEKFPAHTYAEEKLTGMVMDARLNSLRSLMSSWKIPTDESRESYEAYLNTKVDFCDGIVARFVCIKQEPS